MSVYACTPIIFIIIGTLPIVVDMNHVPKLDTSEEELPPPLPERSANLYIDSPAHTVQADDFDSQGLKPRTAPPLSNEASAPALPPKPPRMKLVQLAWLGHIKLIFSFPPRLQQDLDAALPPFIGKVVDFTCFILL